MRLITSNQLTGFIFFIMIVFVAPVHAVVTYTMSVQKTGSGTVILIVP